MMSKIDNLTVLIRNFFIFQQPFILFSIVVIAGLILLSRFQYLNLFLTPEMILVIYWLLVAIVYRLQTKYTFLLAIFILIIVILLLLANLEKVATQTGNAVYFLLFIGFVQSFLSYLKKEIKSKDD